MRHWQRTIEQGNRCFVTGALIDAREHYLHALALAQVLLERWGDADEAVMALVLAGVGMSRFKAMLVGAASGLVEPLFAVLCAWLVGLSALLLPWGLAAAAGAMLFVVTHEIIPESHRQGHAAEATLGLVFGFCLMMVLDTALG